MIDADQQIDHGEASGAWPVGLRLEPIFTAGDAGAVGIRAPGRAVVAAYRAHPEAALAVVGDRYRATSPEEWRDLCRAAVLAGARPTGAFSLRGGSRTLATFEVGTSNGLKTQLVVADSYDGSMRLTAGTSSVRVVCANTLSAAMAEDGDGMAKLRHTASLEERVKVLGESIGRAIASGDKVRTLYHDAEQMRLSKADAQRVMDALFPCAAKDALPAQKTKADKARADARKAMWEPVNNAGGSLATLWNAATYLVDRNADGTPRPTRGGADRLDSMLFGARAERVEEIMTIVQIVMRDGSVQSLPAPQAIEVGADPSQVARAVMRDMGVDLDA